MDRTFHPNDVVPVIKAEVERLNTDGELPPGIKLVPYYDRIGAAVAPVRFDGDVGRHSCRHDALPLLAAR